ncbi:hypothetical protein OF83DRAFT_247053 [Amylostereum chailletii]|nr:hypothetical protein OF83DRAFT_247053 [Amylostereum chailletii]
MYTSVIAILVESALPFSVLGIVTIAVTGKNVFVNSVFLIVWGTFAGLSPLFIILRTAMGMGWSRETTALATKSIVFAPHGVNESGDASSVSGDERGDYPNPASSSAIKEQAVLFTPSAVEGGSSEKV